MDANNLQQRSNNDDTKIEYLKYTKRNLKVILFTLIYSLLSHCKNLWLLIFGRSRKNIAGQLALITGGGGGLGRAIAIELAKNNCNVALADINFTAAEEVALQVRKFGVRVKAYQVDISKYAEIEQLAVDVERDLGPVDILINNAALLTRDNFLETDAETIQDTVNVNLVSYIWTTRVFLSKMIKRHKGHIVAICSGGGIYALSNAIVYSATKFGVNGFMEGLSYELACTNHDYIKTTTIYPTLMSTREDLMEFIINHNYDHYIPALTPEYVAKEAVNKILEERLQAVVPSIYGYLLALKNFLPAEATVFAAKLLFSPFKPVFR